MDAGLGTNALILRYTILATTFRRKNAKFRVNDRLNLTTLPLLERYFPNGRGRKLTASRTCTLRNE